MKNNNLSAKQNLHQIAQSSNNIKHSKLNWSRPRIEILPCSATLGNSNSLQNDDGTTPWTADVSK